jgi:anti-anti-sigma regulatory factor
VERHRHESEVAFEAFHSLTKLLFFDIGLAVDTYIYQRERTIADQQAAIRESRARVVILDITGVPAVDSAIANHLLQTAEASRPMGAKIILTGLSSHVAQALVNLGVDLTKLNAVGDLQVGLDVADQDARSP